MTTYSSIKQHDQYNAVVRIMKGLHKDVWANMYTMHLSINLTSKLSNVYIKLKALLETQGF
jgi:hypothetical protein